MNLRIGRFGQQESAAAVWIASFASGCFALDNRALFENGNSAVLTYALASLGSLLLFLCTVRAIRRRGGTDLFALIGRSRLKAALVPAVILSLLLSAMQPQQQYLLTITQYVFVDAKQISVCFYILPCLALLSMLGAETLVRMARVLLPVLLLSILAAWLIGISQYRVYRLFPVPLKQPQKLLTDTASALHRAFSPYLAMLCIGEGTQNTRALRRAGCIGGALGAATVLFMLLGLSLSFSYAMLAEMPSPFYRMLVEARTENPTLRLDRAALFLWMSGALFSSALYLYAAGVLLCKTFGVRDVRPVACGLSMLSVTTILVLYYDTEATVRILRILYRDAWLLAVVPLPLLCMRGREGTVCGACC